MKRKVSSAKIYIDGQFTGQMEPMAEKFANACKGLLGQNCNLHIGRSHNAITVNAHCVLKMATYPKIVSKSEVKDDDYDEYDDEYGDEYDDEDEDEDGEDDEHYV